MTIGKDSTSEYYAYIIYYSLFYNKKNIIDAMMCKANVYTVSVDCSLL